MANFNFYQLDAWKEGHKLVLLTYQTLKLFPKEELYGLVSQMRRAAVSITSNIAEGFGRPSQMEKIRFYTIACGSLTELQNQMIIARDLEYLPARIYQDQFDHSERVYRIINGLIRSIKI